MVMLMVVVTAAAFALVVMVVMLVILVTAAAFALVVVMVMLVIVATAAAFAIMIMVVVMLMVGMRQSLQVLGEGCLAFHSLQQLRAGELIPGSGNNSGMIVMLPEQSHGSIQLCLGNGIAPGQNDGGSGFDLVVVELAEVLHVNLHLTRIRHGNGIAQGYILARHLFHSGNHIGELTDAGGLDDNPVGMILVNDLSQGLTEVAHQAAADTAGIHFGDVDAGLLEEAAVNADLAELVFDQHQFLARIGFLNHLLDQGRLAGAQESGVNINLRHRKSHLSDLYFHTSVYIISGFQTDHS